MHPDVLLLLFFLKSFLNSDFCSDKTIVCAVYHITVILDKLVLVIYYIYYYIIYNIYMVYLLNLKLMCVFIVFQF